MTIFSDGKRYNSKLLKRVQMNTNKVAGLQPLIERESGLNTLGTQKIDFPPRLQKKYRKV